MDDKVSIIIPTYNCEKTIDRTIQSILNQTYTCFEIIIINDCSTDDTSNILYKYRKINNISIIHNHKNYGKFISVNIGIQRSIGKYITIVDADDYLHKDKINHQIITFNIFEKCVAVFHNILVYNMDGSSKIRNHAEISVMFKKKNILETIGYFDSNRYGSDTEFKERLIKYFDKNRIIMINKILYFAQKRMFSLTTNSITGINSIYRKIYEKKYKEWHITTKNLYIDFPQLDKYF